MSRPTVSITYCADCGYDGQAVELAGALLRDFGHDLSQLSIIPWHEGTFDVMIDSTLVHSMATSGGFPDVAMIGNALRSTIATKSTEKG